MLVLIDGNSILNRAFYGIMSSKMLMTTDGKYTNAVYGFLSILFKLIDETNPTHMAIAFDLKAPTHRHLLYKEYKGTRKSMPEELAYQMPMIKEILRMMNIVIVEKEGFEADDIIGTLAKYGEKYFDAVHILSGDRDNFQLIGNKVFVRMPESKMGKTQTIVYGKQDIIEKYGVRPDQLIEVKGLMGDTSDNIPGVPGVGEKTALNLIKEFSTVEKLYEAIEKNEDGLKGKTREKIVENKELAFLSKKLGTIETSVDLGLAKKDLEIKEWDKDAVYNRFKELNFNRFLERFKENLDVEEEQKELTEILNVEQIDKDKIKDVLKLVEKQGSLIYLLNKEKIKDFNSISKNKIKGINIYISSNNTSYNIDIANSDFMVYFKSIFENNSIKKIGYKLIEDYVICRELGIKMENIFYDTQVASYVLEPTVSKYELDIVSKTYLNIEMSKYTEKYKVEYKKEKQISIFDIEEEVEEVNENDKYIYGFDTYIVNQIYEKTYIRLKEENMLDLFNNIEMPLIAVLGDMQFNGMMVDKKELQDFGLIISNRLEEIKVVIYDLAEEEFNINSTQQLGKILFEKIKLPVIKKTKSGYSTDVDVLEKLKPEHEIIEHILEYRSLAKLNSTYVEGLLPHINKDTNRIHSHFNQTITATGRISSSEPNLQNIPTRYELGKKLRKVFKPEKGYTFIDADYSQIELRVLAHISGDENMIEAFKNDEDIHTQVASKVFNEKLEDVTKEQRSAAKAVNFGIVYGISDYGLAGQLMITKKEAQKYIDQYLEKYAGIDNFMKQIVEKAKESGYVESLFNRRRYIPELGSSNYMVRQFGSRVAMNTPIQGTAADIMKIAMINVDKKLKEENLDVKIILQVHDELILECKEEEKQKASKILFDCMQNACELIIPLKPELSYANNWYEAK